MSKLDLVEVLNRTFSRKNQLKSFERYFSDPEKEKRLSEQECIICYYSGKLGGAAITKSDCGLCEIEMTFGSTCIDRLCLACAKLNKLCKHCGADIAYKKRNKL